ncbi:tagatose 1,6-diphosphate aldolase [Shinella zoogloeoides]|uniref:tagatose 1,6-diphosphate aldolase n=1 Tax=Shinella zoogloeoides TaxID=352475 RepID=UPI0028A646D3|nr:tagatose 1,6-diphosphate aldolase [Shinella zoogloeoides]
MTELSSGKLRGLKKLADKSGRFKMLAIDQRAPMARALDTILAPRKASYDDVAPIKSLLAETLAPESSAVLVDPDFGLTPCEPFITRDNGLLITLETPQFEETKGGRKSAPLKDLDVAKIKRLGADGVKLMLWYRADADNDVRAHQQSFARQVGEECRRHDIPFLLELLVYPFLGEANHSTDYKEDERKRPELVLEGLRHFADPEEFGVDIHKVESPVAAKDLPDPDGSEAIDSQSWFDKVSTIIDRPWVLLSAGADMAQFERILTYAYRAGANGYLAGRAIWWPAFQALPDLARMKAILVTDALEYQNRINCLTDKEARSWTSAGCFHNGLSLSHGGEHFPSAYGSNLGA